MLCLLPALALGLLLHVVHCTVLLFVLLEFDDLVNDMLKSLSLVIRHQVTTIHDVIFDRLEV